MAIEPDPILEFEKFNTKEDIVQYYIVRSDLGMSTGKIGAQISHATKKFMLGYQNVCRRCQCMPVGGLPLIKKNITEKWLGSSYPSIILKAKKKDFDKLKEELDVFIVVDEGRTEVEAGSETVMVTWPMRKDAAPKKLQRLQALKEPT